MKEIFYLVNWLPFVWILIQSYLFLSMALFMLRKTKLLVSPIAGMEYGYVASAGSLLLGSLLLSTGEISPIFQAAKTLQYGGDHVLSNTLLKFTEYFLVAVLSMGVFLITGFCNHRYLFKTKMDNNPNDGNTAVGILIGCINIGFAIVLGFWVKELAERITPTFVNFR